MRMRHFVVASHQPSEEEEENIVTLSQEDALSLLEMMFFVHQRGEKK